MIVSVFNFVTDDPTRPTATHHTPSHVAAQSRTVSCSRHRLLCTRRTDVATRVVICRRTRRSIKLSYKGRPFAILSNARGRCFCSHFGCRSQEQFRRRRGKRQTKPAAQPGLILAAARGVPFFPPAVCREQASIVALKSSQKHFGGASQRVSVQARRGEMDCSPCN